MSAKILVVDDEADVRRYITAILDKAGLSDPVTPEPVLGAKEILRLREIVRGIYVDDKIIAVSANDPVYQERRKLEDLPDHKLREIQRFFEDYKALEHKEVVVEGMQEREQALQILRDGLVMYRKLRRGELAKG